VGIPAGIFLFEVSGMESFSQWKQRWREKLSRGNFEAGIGEETSVPADSSNLSIV
jgi:hypothetical protein